MSTNSYKSDAGAIFGQSYDITVDGYAYVCKTVDHNKPTAGIEIKTSAGLFKGGADLVGRDTVQVEIDAITGTPPPSQLVPFAQAFHGYTSLNWMVHGLSLKSGNEQGRTYSAELKQYASALV